MNSKPISVFVFGPAACGKGSLCRVVRDTMREDLHVVEMSKLLGPLFESNAEYREMAAKGELLPLQEVMPIFKDHILRKTRDSSKKINLLCDGAGRKALELEDYLQMFGRIQPMYSIHAVFLQTNTDIIRARAQKRTEDRRKEGKLPRPEDLGNGPMVRYQLHMDEEHAIEKCAKKYGVECHHLDARHCPEVLALNVLKIFYPHQSLEGLSDWLLASLITA